VGCYQVVAPDHHLGVAPVGAGHVLPDAEGFGPDIMLEQVVCERKEKL
jgi:hypothetical protein